MAEIKKDTVEYRDPTPFDGSKLQPISEISKAIRHKNYGVDTREAIAQQGEALIKIMQETGGNQSAEVIAARGDHAVLSMREDAQDEALNNKADKDYINNYLSQVSYIPETVANVNDLKTKYPNGKPGLFITADTGHKYIWSNNSWTDAGPYQATAILKKTVNFSKISDIYDLKDEGEITPQKYIGGYDPEDNTIVLSNYQNTKMNVLQLNTIFTGIVHVPKNNIQTNGQSILFTNKNNVMIFKNYWPYTINNQSDVAVDYFVYVTDDEILINLDRVADSVGENFKLWISYSDTVEMPIYLTNAKLNTLKNYLI